MDQETETEAWDRFAAAALAPAMASAPLEVTDAQHAGRAAALADLLVLQRRAREPAEVAAAPPIRGAAPSVPRPVHTVQPVQPVPQQGAAREETLGGHARVVHHAPPVETQPVMRRAAEGGVGAPPVPGVPRVVHHPAPEAPAASPDAGDAPATTAPDVDAQGAAFVDAEQQQPQQPPQ